MDSESVPFGVYYIKAVLSAGPIWREFDAQFGHVVNVGIQLLYKSALQILDYFFLILDVYIFGGFCVFVI